ncbi:MAG: hypothetical protein LBV12_10280 [Puniceicoccales bacterium]|jgi:hypothetical protein|nr:hypothetical protein [Puniceicoccales bacterium]
MRFFLPGLLLFCCVFGGCATSEPEEPAYVDDITVPNDFYIAAVDGEEPARTGEFSYVRFAPFVRLTPGKHNLTLSKKKTPAATGSTHDSNLARTIKVVVESGAGYRISDAGLSLIQISAP